MNTYIPIFFFLIFILLSIYGIIYTAKNNSNLSKEVDNEKKVAHFSDLQIKDTEALGIDFWSGSIKIYETRIIIENSSYFHHFIKKNVAHNKKPMTITLNDCYIKGEYLILIGTKHRVLHNSSITVRLKAKNIDDLMKIKKLIK